MISLFITLRRQRFDLTLGCKNYVHNSLFTKKKLFVSAFNLSTIVIMISKYNHVFSSLCLLGNLFQLIINQLNQGSLGVLKYQWY